MQGASQRGGLRRHAHRRWPPSMTPSVTPFRDSPVGLPCWTPLLNSPVGLSCWTLLLDSLVGLSCWTLLLDSLVGLSCWTPLFDFIACPLRPVLIQPHQEGPKREVPGLGAIGRIRSLSDI
jgi:hypothetical protein